ncbi:hypothetical protein [Streptomyces sp. VMFN-G11Ma]|jgi:hypothetical protein|uniref:hypothetical protein n=1 Tax=Streptomyces sp. VMFN-G11Ma TaxID=2135609 RepID=UPI000D38451E|nr:hypothetical protein [Streptomyces sp. VMFN-G11Ma]PTM99295.1 hypothetical protein C7821_102238 [Streptomyces sp. VMFN-G11Ma]
MDAQEFRDDEAFEPVATKELILTEETLRGDDAPRRTLVEGTVRYGAPRIAYLPPSNSTDQETEVHLLPDPQQWKMYLAAFPYTFEWPGTGRTFHRADVKFESLEPSITAYSLVPLDESSPVESTRSYTVTPQFQFMNMGVGLGGIARQVVFTKLQPVITAYGLGTNAFSWRYSSPPGGSLRDGSRLSAAVLQVPLTVQRFTLTARTSFTVSRRRYGRWLDGDGDSDLYSFDIDLPSAG